MISVSLFNVIMIILLLLPPYSLFFIKIAIWIIGNIYLHFQNNYNSYINTSQEFKKCKDKPRVVRKKETTYNPIKYVKARYNNYLGRTPPFRDGVLLSKQHRLKNPREVCRSGVVHSINTAIFLVRWHVMEDNLHKTIAFNKLRN